MVFAQMKDTAKAIEALEKAYNLQPLKMLGLSLANLYAETKNQKTLSVCDQLIIRDSTSEFIDPIYLKGVYFANVGDRENAVKQFDICIERDWKFIEAYIEKGILFYEQKQYDEALKTFQLAANVSNTYADAYYWMGKCNEAKGDKRAAVNNYYKALSLERNFREAAEGLERVKD
jgi:tetratricopeptide (TPR) repeat protein